MAESRVLKFNEANVQKQKELSKQYTAKNKKGISQDISIDRVEFVTKTNSN